MLRYNGTTIGKIVIEQGRDEKRKFTLQIRQGNCLAVIIHVAKITEGEDKGMYRHTLFTFYSDDKHCKNIIKNGDTMLFGEKVISIKLNMYYKENYTLLKYFVLSGYKVQCYYKDPTKKAKK